MATDHILTPDTQAILLLCGTFDGAFMASAEPLSLSEYNALAALLHRESLRPNDLLGGDALRQITPSLPSPVEPERLRALLGRGVEMGFAVEEWARQGIWVVSRGEASYPRALKSRLRGAAPPLLFGVGERDAVERGGLGLVGSQGADERALGFARRVAGRCAGERMPVVVGGTKGFYREVMDAALRAGGLALGVVPEGVAKLAFSKANRGPIARGSLTLVSPFHPNAQRTPSSALVRNRHIYALSDWTLVVSAETGGETWNGAAEALERGWGRVVVRVSHGAPEGNAELIASGGAPLEAEAAEQAESMQGLFEATAPTKSGTT